MLSINVKMYGTKPEWLCMDKIREGSGEVYHELEYIQNSAFFRR